MKLARRNEVTLPIGICLSCFNAQQQFRFPFLVYCSHSETLAVIRKPDEHATFRCAPAQLEQALRHLHEAQTAPRSS